MAVFGVELQAHPLGKVGVDIRSYIIPCIVNVGISQDTFLGICPAGDIISHFVRPSAYTQVVVLLESEILVVQVEIVSVADTVLGILVSGIERGVRVRPRRHWTGH